MLWPMGGHLVLSGQHFSRRNVRLRDYTLRLALCVIQISLIKSISRTDSRETLKLRRLVSANIAKASKSAVTQAKTSLPTHLRQIGRSHQSH